MSNGLLYIAGLIALALAALFAVPYFIDWNGYRGVFEEEATRILGREVRVGGNVNVRLLPSPYVSFEKLRIADPTGATGEPFFRADSFTMRLSAPPLLKGVIEANEIVLEKPFLRLAVDADGAGNWRSFSIAPGALPFVPAGVSLQSVKIADGTVAFYGPKGIGFAELGGLNGELKAESVAGPFAFKGSANWDGGEREVRIATAAMDPQGAIRFKATVRGTSASNNLYVLDGRLEDIKDRPRIDGEISAKLALAPGELPIAVAVDPLAPPPPATAPPGTPSFGLPLATKAEVPMIDVKAHVVGDSKGLRLDNIALAFEHVGQPQHISGSATAKWSEKLSVDMDLSSRWLDLDRVAKTKEGAGGPLETARNFIKAMMESLPPAADSKISLDLDQASLGGEAVSDIKLEVARNQGVLLVTNLRAGLPGGASLKLDGAVGDADSGQAFRGGVTLHGTSFSRFLDWAVKDKALAEAARTDGPFSLQGRLSMSERSIDLTDAGAEIGGRPLTGEVHYARKDRPRLAVVLEGGEIDAGQFWPAGVRALTSVLAQGKAADAAPTVPALAWVDPATTDFGMRLRAGVLLTEHGRLRDVDIDVGLEQGRLAVRALKFQAADGLQLELEGNLADAGKAPKGALQGVLNAPSKDAYAALLKLLDLSDETRRRAEGLAALVPMRLAGTIGLGIDKGGASLAVDGSVQGSGRLVATARMDGGFAGWRTAPADITLAVDGPDVATMAAGLGGRAPARATATAQPGEIFLKAVGTPASGMMATATAKAQGLFLGYDGRVVVPEGSRALDGELRVSARSLSDALAVAGLGGGAALNDIPVVGTLKLTSADRATELEPVGLAVGGSRINGALALAYPSEGAAIVTGQVDVDAATIPGLLALVLDRRQLAEAPGAEPLTAGKSIWPEHAFDFTALDGVEGKLSVGFGSLTLADDMSVAKARAEVELAPGKVSVTKLVGKVLGGELASNIVLERAPGGANLTADLSIEGMQVRPVSAAAGNASSEPHASLSLKFSGRASTPGALVSVVSGNGELKLGDLQVHAPTPLAVVATSEAVLSGDAGGSGEQLIAALRTQFETAEVKVGPRTIPIEIGDGAAKLALVTLDSEAGTTKVETTVDLASLVVDSAWRVEPRAPDAPAPPPQPQPGQAQVLQPTRHGLPAVGVVYTGPLANVWALDQRITTDALERELSIRKMELDADQLERLHKADAERARRDYERRKALESDEAAPTPPPPTPAAAPPGGAAAVVPVPPQPPAAADTGAVDPALPQAVGAAPAIPPSSASASGVHVPPAPGQDPQQTFGAGAPVDPAAVPPTADALNPTPTYRPRRPQQRPVQPNEQVLRSLTNN